ncbi:MAG: hypothetical protein ACI37Z_03350 [Candidatus Gastranaerophilaceae bacterium]
MIKNKQKVLLGISSVLIFGLLFLFFSSPIYADGGTSTFVETITSLYLSDIGRLITTCFNSLCVLGVGITIVQLLISKDQKVVNGAYKFIGTVCTVFLIFNLLGSILLFVGYLIPTVYYDYDSQTTESGLPAYSGKNWAQQSGLNSD